MTSATQEGPELAAMAQVLRTLEALENAEAQQRVLDWASVRLGLSESPQVKKTPRAKPDSGKPFAENEAPAVREGTINTVASKLGVNSCQTLLVAAAAYLLLYKGKEKFSREELVSCAKEARVWKSDYSVQTSVNINRMCDAEELIEKSKDVYDLSQKKLAELEKKLSE